MVDFLAKPSMKPGPGSVLRVGGDGGTYLRITHLFDHCVYAMWVGEANQARSARRPHKVSFGELEELACSEGAQWGRIVLPPAFSDVPVPQSQQGVDLAAAWHAVEPLVTQYFPEEQNLARDKFSLLIHQRAAALCVSRDTLRRWVLRYYYFGGTRLALLPLPSGIAPHSERDNASRPSEDSVKQVAQRRGPKSVLYQQFGVNTFIVSDDDIGDMRAALRRLRAHGRTTKTDAHED
jgi:putative transposase